MNIRVDLNYPIKDGTEVVFRSPVDCSQVTGLKVYYIGADGNTAFQEFAFADAHGNNVGDIDHLFAENVAVKVILDVTSGMAFVQNADTNAYLEGRFQELEEKLGQGGGSYYHTEREELEIAHENVNTAYIIGLYDALMAEYPDNVQKNAITNDDGTFTNYEYVISTGEYNTAGYYYKYGTDVDIKKPKYLILSGIHGAERKAVLSAYRFIRDLLSGHNIPAQFREGCVIHIMPVGNPSGIDTYTRTNDNGVDLNRNFNWNWEETKAGTNRYSGSSAMSEKETQAIANWLNANINAEVFIDCHNSGIVNEVAMIMGVPDNEAVDNAKKIALRGLDRIVPLWRDVIGYQPMETVQWNSKTKEIETVVKEPIFSQSVSNDEGGMAAYYATDVVGVPSLVLELSSYQNGNYSDFIANEHLITPETIAAGAEALGNILIEFYFDSSEVVDMTEVNGKLDALTESMNSVSKGFRVESGVMVVESDILPAEGSSTFYVRIPCSNGAKVFYFHADDTTRNAIANAYKTEESPNEYTGSVFGNCCAPGVVDYAGKQRSYMATLYHFADITWHNGWLLADKSTTVRNTDGAEFNCFALKAGTYNWTAYYWNE